MTDSSKLVIGYVRVSSDDQVDHGISLDAQRASIQAWADARGLDCQMFGDKCLSGGRADNRPGLRGALALATHFPGASFVVYSLSRLTRDVADAQALTAQLDGHWVQLVSLTESLQREHALGRLMFTVQAGFATYERQAITELTQAAMDHKRARGNG